MLMILSPAKTLDFETDPSTRRRSTPACLDEAAELVKILREFSTDELTRRMKLSPALAQATCDQYANWQRRCSPGNSRPAVLAYRGNAYVGLAACEFSDDDFVFAQETLRILSGLYGVLRPLDLIQPYRLEMAMKLETSRGRTLHDFWKERITGLLKKQLEQAGGVLINLASKEYFKAIVPEHLAAEVLTVSFKEERDGELRTIAALAKKARGLMASFVIGQRLVRVEDLREFDLEGYRFDAGMSSAVEYVFTRTGI